MLREKKVSVSASPAPSRVSNLLIRATKSALIPNVEVVDNLLVIPPDGGWGWVIVAMAFISYFIIDGVMYTFGLFLDEISETFKVEPTEVALATSLMSGFYFLVGPLTCAITNRYGFRIVGVIGAVISALAFLFTTFFLNLNAFFILMGVICGIGFNMIYIPCLLVVGFYFNKWRALATAISLCGSSIGVIAFPTLVTTLMKSLHWTWKFRILSALTGLTSLCAFTFRPLKPIVVVEETRKYTLDTINDSENSVDITGLGTKPIFNTFPNTMFPTASQYVDATNIYSAPPSRRMTEHQTGSDQSITRSTFIYKTDNSSRSLSTVYELDDEKNERKTNHCKACCRHIFCSWVCCDICKKKASETVINVESINRPLYKDDIFYAGSIFLLPEYSKATLGAGPSSKKSSLSYHLSVSRLPTQRDIAESGQCLCCPEAVVRPIVTMLHLKLFKSLTFVVLTISGFLSMMGLYCPFIFLVQRATDMDISEDWAKLLLTIIGVANTLGRIMCGVISWFPQINLIAVNYVTLMIAGVSIIVSSYLPHLEGQIAFAAIFGFNIASLTVLRSIVVVELMGLENLTNAFGITSMFFGLGAFSGVPVAGSLKTATGSYDASFIFAGCCMFLSGVLIIPLRQISNWETERTKKVMFKT